MKMLFPKYEDIKTMYGWGCYTNTQIKWFVDMEVIDKEEYALITGEKYPEQPQA
ncbi:MULTISPECIES: XkdX family protein [Staphylococcus]|uniref:XkdX family protein n=1 Tax=Staphylococcus TaxID=1279 RepID=UPI0009BF8EFD|nr:MULTISPECIES: XkdX family protein [Staphylococcus]MDW3859264.1 XkdX family protein [Staphylococcus saprophyticus]MDW4090458.1 XkdX family protein [Staphylococcus saprophyticus]MDW4214008.1 XkdX family protein [Staphylococcus saprophyticus]MDW4363248.1 XkdX family protein [Staphylococcus saprophyticus]PTE75905.1 XkdX family protein [Staphylococcus gallinarum]